MKVAEAARQDRYARTALADARDRLERVHAALPTPPARSVGQAAVVEEQGSVATEAPALDAETRAMLDRLNAGRSGTPGSPVPRELRPDDSPARRPAPRPGRDGTER